MKSPFKLLLSIAVVLTMAFPLLASADVGEVIGTTIGEGIGMAGNVLTLNVPIGNLTSCSIGAGASGNNCLGLYIKAWYGFALGVVGILATFMIMFAGFKYLTSGVDSGAIGEAKKLIVSGVSGVIIAFLSYTILSLVNPQLLTISMPTLPGIKDTSGITVVSSAPGVNSASERNSASGNLPLNTNYKGDFAQTLSKTEALSGLKFPTAKSGVRPNDGGSLHELGRATDYPRNDVAFNMYMDSLIKAGTKTTYDFEGQPVYYVRFPDGTMGRIINETENNCWHVDNGQEGEQFGDKKI